MGWPEMIYLTLLFMALGISMAKHGEMEIREENFFTKLLMAGIQIALLWWGGFFG